MSNQIDEIKKRTYRYFYEDGIVEMGVGLLFLTIGLVLWFIAVARQGSLPAIVGWLALMLLTGGGAYLVPRVISRLKEQMTYPRTGYVAYQEKPNRSRWIVGIVALVLAVVLVRLPYEWADKMSLMVGALLMVVHFFMGARVALTRMYVVGVLAALLGLVAAVAGLEDIQGTAATFGGTGIALIAFGAWALMDYLRRYPSSDSDYPSSDNFNTSPEDA